MESSFYMRVGVTENLINPQIKLDGKWEVSLCDISLSRSGIIRYNVFPIGYV